MVDLNNTYWEKLDGYVTELRVDARWILRNNGDDKPYGSLRIVSHPDLQPGYLRAIFTYVISIFPKSVEEKIRTIEDYHMNELELEVYSLDENIETSIENYEAPYKELQEIFGVKVFD